MLVIPKILNFQKLHRYTTMQNQDTYRSVWKTEEALRRLEASEIIEKQDDTKSERDLQLG